MWCSIIILAIVLFLAILVSQQRKLLYLNSHAQENLPPSEWGVPEVVALGEAKVYAECFAQSNKGIAFFFHGNAGSVSNSYYSAEPLYRAGYSLAIVEYRGYGKSSKEFSPTQTDIVADSKLVFEHFYNAHKEVLFYGQSLGTGVVLQLLSQIKVPPNTKVVLENPFTSIGDIVPFPFPVFDNWASKDVITGATKDVKLLIITSEHDLLVPPAHSKVLFGLATECAEKTHVILTACSHVGARGHPDYLEAIDHFL